MSYNDIYFWTATINSWQHLLSGDEYKNVIIDSLNFLSSNRKMDIYAFVIMPNHLHFLWRMLALNGKETPMGSFLKYTAHVFKKMIIEDATIDLANYKVSASNKNYEFWDPKTLAFPVQTRDDVGACLNYIHYNPLQSHWKLVKHPCDYKYSSARFYKSFDKTEFPFLRNIWLDI